MLHSATEPRSPDDPFRIALVTVAPLEHDNAALALERLLASAFPSRFPGQIRLNVQRRPDAGVEREGIQAQPSARGTVDLLLASSADLLDVAMTEHEMPEGRSFVIDHLSSRLQLIADERGLRPWPPLGRAGVRAWCERLIRHAAAVDCVAESPLANELASRAASGDAVRIARLSDAIRRLAVKGMPQATRDPRHSVPTRLRELSGTF